MKISKRGEYALRALIDIGIAKELGRDTPLEEVLTGLFADLLGVPSVGAG